MRKLLLAIALLWPSLALAADIASAQTTPVVTKSTGGTPCSPTSCTGFYAGGFLAGNGTNADIIGSGIDGSVFAGGGIPGFDIGYQFANGTWFLGGEAGVGWQVNTATTANGTTTNESGVFGYEIAKVGGQLSGLLGTTASITPPSALTAQVISPYGLVGAVERQFASGWATGAGVTFDISPKVFLDLKYMYVNYGAGATVGNLTFPSENILMVSMNYKF